MAVLTIQASAYDFSSDTQDEYPTTLYYAINPDGKTVTIVEGPSTYKAQEINIPATVTYNDKTYTVTVIGAGAFANSDVKRMVMPSTITDIQDNAFNQSSIAIITFSIGLKHIGNYAFRCAPNLTQADLPEGVESIGDDAFSQTYSAGLKTVTLPSTLKSMGRDVFMNSALISVKWPASLPKIPNRTFAGCQHLSEVELPEGLEVIDDNAFDATAIENIIFPTTLKEIGRRAFWKTKFKEMAVPNHILKLGDGAFEDCERLEKIYFSTGMTKIPELVCGGCAQLTEINIPSTITYIGSGAFASCPRLNNVVIPESVRDMGEYVFRSSGIINISLSKSMHYIPSSTFMSCEKLTNITLPENVDSIGGEAFSWCKELTSIILPKKLKYLGTSFMDSKIRSITLGNYVEQVSSYAFFDMSELKEVHVNRNLPPNIINTSGLDIIRANENTTVLYVPRGTKQSYEIADGWKDFYEIVEEDVDGSVNFYVQTSVVSSYGGRIQVDDENKTDGIYERPYNKPVTLTLMPEEKFMLEKLTINGKDVTADVIENTYTIANMDENKIVRATFKRSPIILSVHSGMGGSVEMSVEWGTPVTFSVKADDEWQVNSVVFNGADVTSEVTNDQYTTTELYQNATLSISFEQVATGIKSENKNNVKAYGNSGVLQLTGLNAGEAVKVMDTSGALIKTFKASNSETSITLEPNHVYLINVEGKTFKVAL